MPAPIAAIPNRAGGHRPAALGALPGSGYRPGGCQDTTRCPPGAGSQHPSPPGDLAARCPRTGPCWGSPAELGGQPRCQGAALKSRRFKQQPRCNVQARGCSAEGCCCLAE